MEISLFIAFRIVLLEYAILNTSVIVQWKVKFYTEPCNYNFIAHNSSTCMHAFLKTDDIYKPQLLEKPCYPLETTYLVFHNITSIQSPITTNRTNVTLYGVQPGETYTVEITVQFREGEPKKFTFS